MPLDSSIGCSSFSGWNYLKNIVGTSRLSLNAPSNKNTQALVHCDPDKIKVIYVALPDGFERHDKPFNGTQVRVLQIGTAPNKNVPKLIEALKDLPVHLDLIGGFNATYERQLQQMGIEYTYRRNFNAAEMLDAYRRADIVSLVSTYEGFGMPLLKAKQLAGPLLRQCGFDARCRRRWRCLWILLMCRPFATALCALSRTQTIASPLIVKGFENVNASPPDVIAEQYLQLYRDVAGGEFLMCGIAGITGSLPEKRDRLPAMLHTLHTGDRMTEASTTVPRASRPRSSAIGYSRSQPAGASTDD